MISQTAEYALRAVVWLARNGDAPQTNRAIARGTRVPAGYLAKVLQGLARAGLADSRRGLHGGFTLAVAPEQITVLEVINSVDPIRRIRECPLGLAYHGRNLCPLHRRLDDAVGKTERELERTTVAEILAEPSPHQPLCRPNRARRGGPARRRRKKA